MVRILDKKEKSLIRIVLKVSKADEGMTIQIYKEEIMILLSYIDEKPSFICSLLNKLV